MAQKARKGNTRKNTGTRKSGANRSKNQKHSRGFEQAGKQSHGNDLLSDDLRRSSLIDNNPTGLGFDRQTSRNRGDNF